MTGKDMRKLMYSTVLQVCKGMRKGISSRREYEDAVK